MRESLPKLHLSPAGPRQRWYVRVRLPGKDYPERVYLGLSAFMDKRQARDARKEKLSELSKLAPIDLSRAIKFADFVEFFRQESLNLSKMKKSSFDLYTMILKNHVLPVFGPMKMCDVKTVHVNTWLRDLHEKKGHSWKTLRLERGFLRSIFASAVDVHDLLVKNPVAKSEYPCPKQLKREKRRLTPEELNRVWEKVPRLRFILQLEASTGLRISEVLGLRWQNVDLLAGTITIKERYYQRVLDTPKNKAVRDMVFPLCALTEDLHRQKIEAGDSPFVFPSPRCPMKQPISYPTLHALLKGALEDLGLYTEGTSFHALRRTYISEMGENGVNSVEQAALVGKASPESLMEYHVPSLERRTELVDRIQKRFGIQ